MRRRWNLPGLACMLAVSALAASMLAVSLVFSLAVAAQAGTQHPAQYFAQHLDWATGVATESAPAAAFRPIIVDLGALCGGHSDAWLQCWSCCACGAPPAASAKIHNVDITRNQC